MARAGRAVSRGATILIGILIVTAALLFAWQHRPTVAAWLISGVLTANGVPEADLTVSQIDLEGVTLVDGRIGDAGPAFRELRVNYVPHDLVRGRVGEIEITGLHVPATLGDNGLEVVGLESVLAGDDDGSEATPINPPVGSIRLIDSTVDLVTAFGAMSVGVDGVIRVEEAGGLSGSLNLDQSGARAESSSTLHFEVSPAGASKGDIQLHNALLNLPDSGLTASLAGGAAFEAGPSGLTRLSGDILLRHVVAGDVDVPDAVFEIDIQDDAVAAHGLIYGADQRPELELHAAAPNLRDAPELNIQLQLDMHPESLIWRYLAMDAPRDGTASLDLDLVASLPFDPADAQDISVGEMVDAVTATGSLEISADGLTFADGVSQLHAGGRTEVSFSRRTLELDAVGPMTFGARLPAEAAADLAGDPPAARRFRLSVSNQDDTEPLLLVAFDPDMLHGSVAADVRMAPLDAGELSARLQGSTEIAYDGAVRGYEFAVTDFTGTRFELPGWKVTLDAATLAVSGSADGAAGRVYLSTIARPTGRSGLIAAIQGELNGRLDYHGDGLTVAIEDDSSLQLETAPGFGDLRPSEPLSFGVQPGGSFIEAEFADSLRINHRLIATLPRAVLIDRRSGARAADGRAMTLTMTGSSVWPEQLHDLTAQLGIDRIDLPEAQIRINDIRAQAVLPDKVGRGKPFANFEAVGLTDLAVPRRIVPLRLAGRLTRLRGATGISAKLTDTGGAAELRVNGRLDESGGGTVDVWVPRIDFVAGGLQPRDIAPFLPNWIGTAEGGLGVKGPVTWGAGGLTSDVRVVANNLSMVVGGNAIRGLNGVVEIDGFNPLVTAPQQLIGVKTIDIGVPLTDGKIRFDVGAGGRLRIHETSWGLAGGRIGAEGVVLDSGSDAHRIELRADGLDLQSLVGLADLDGLTAGGTVSGRIPVTIKNGQLMIRDGSLQTVGGGLLRYRPEPMPAALQQGGETVSLMVKALDNFQYDKLQVKLNRDADGEAALGLHIDGRNPDLYDGYPVEFNLNLTGKLDEILTKGIQTYQIPDAIRGKVEGL